jgi:RND family efflux transporter MFP subunit
MQIWVLVLAVLATVTLQGCSDGDEVAVQQKATVVELVDVQVQTRETIYTFPATVVPKSTANLAFRVGGRLDKVSLTEGQFVKKGALLAKLDPTNFLLAKAKAKVQLKQAKLALKRVQAIATKGIGSEQSVDNAQVAVELAEIGLETAALNMRYSELYAPFDALIAKRLIENQGYIKTGSVVAHLQDLSRIHFKFDVSERLVSRYRSVDSNGTKASAYIDGHIDQSFDIEYLEHSTEPDPVTQTYQVIFAMDYPKGLDITPGIRATVSIKSNNEVALTAVGVPINALVTGNDDTLYVWLQDEKTKTVNKQIVTVGPMSQGWIAILSGLKAGQKVVASGSSLMKPDMLVRAYVAE